jgi:phage repressor protein C with HTH and peptisase S24 domain
MAVLGSAALAGIARKIQRAWSDTRESTAFTKAQLAAAVAAADQWADDNAAAYNTALPAAFRNNATAAQKSLLLVYVIARRAGFTEWADGD